MNARQSRGRRGQALVEFAFVFPVFVVMLFGLIDGGRLVFANNTLSNAAREGARVAIVNQATSGGDTCDTTQPTAWAIGCAISSGASLGITATDVSVTYRNAADTGPCSTADPAVLAIGCLAVVTVTHQFTPLTPIVGALVGPVTLTSTARVPVERVCASNC